MYLQPKWRTLHRFLSMITRNPRTSLFNEEKLTFFVSEIYKLFVHFSGNTNPLLSVEALEKMMEDPKVQKMIYPYLPEETRNPATFKWMLQNPQYRQQLQDMLLWTCSIKYPSFSPRVTGP